MRTEQPTKCVIQLQKLKLEPLNWFKPPSGSLLAVSGGGSVLVLCSLFMVSDVSP